MKNLIISCLIAWIIHAENWIVHCSTRMEYGFTIFCMTACCFMGFEAIDATIMEIKRERQRKKIRERMMREKLRRISKVNKAC